MRQSLINCPWGSLTRYRRSAKTSLFASGNGRTSSFGGFSSTRVVSVYLFRFGKRKNEFIRFGKRKNEFIRYSSPRSTISHRNPHVYRFGRSGADLELDAGESFFSCQWSWGGRVMWEDCVIQGLLLAGEKRKNEFIRFG